MADKLLDRYGFEKWAVCGGIQMCDPGEIIEDTVDAITDVVDFVVDLVVDVISWLKSYS